MVNEQEKERVRLKLIEGLKIEEIQIKGQFALCLGTVAKYDFPNKMPNLLEFLITQIKEKTNKTEGSGLVLEMIVHPDCKYFISSSF